MIYIIYPIKYILDDDWVIECEKLKLNDTLSGMNVFHLRHKLTK
jgi:hypothetical protein